MSRRLCLAGLPTCTDVTNIIPEKVRLAKGVRTKNRKKEKLRIPQITTAAPGGEEDEHKADDPGRRFAEADGAVTDLRNTNEEIMSIALNYQFSSPGYFSKRFKGYTGLTPTEYRR